METLFTFASVQVMMAFGIGSFVRVLKPAWPNTDIEGNVNILGGTKYSMPRRWRNLSMRYHVVAK